MNIIQLFDLLKIEKNHVAMFSDFDIMRIEEELNIERKINAEIDVNLANNLISILKKEKENLLFVLNSRQLYNLFANRDLPKSSFVSNQNIIDENQIKSFLEQYLSDDLSMFFDKEIANFKFSEVVDLLAIKKYFPKDIILKLEKKIHFKLDFAVQKLSQTPLNLIHIEYVKNNYFYRLLNVFSSIETDDKVRNLISPIVEKYNGGYSKEFLSNAMIAMFNYNAFDEDLQKIIADNKISMFGNQNKSNKLTTPENNSKTSWIIGGLLFFGVIVILLLISKSNNKQTSNSDIFNEQNNQNSFNDDVNIEQLKLEQTTNFYGFLTNFDSSDIDEITLNKTIKTGQNPFNNVYKFINLKNINTKKINFENTSNYDVVVLMNYKIKIEGDFANRSYRSPKTAFYIKAKEKFQIDNDTVNGLVYSFYFGKKLASFESKPNATFKTKDSIPDYRFSELARNADKIIEQEMIFINDVTIFEKNDQISWKQSTKIQTP